MLRGLVRNLSFAILARASSLLSVTTRQQCSTISADLCADGGTNVSTMGSIFHIFEYSECKANMEGFAYNFTKINIPIGSRVTIIK